jgi:hypothetical protein
MRTLLIVGPLTLVPAVTRAQPQAACEKVATVPSEMRTDTPLLAARLSMATCEASVRMASLTIVDDDVSLRLIADAAQPSFATFEDVAASGDPRWQILAARADADLRFGMVARMRASIPPVPAGETGDALVNDLADRAERRARLEPQLAPWTQQAVLDLERAIAIAQANPSVLRDVAVDAAIRQSQQDLDLLRRTR